MQYVVEVFLKDKFRDKHGEHVKHDIAEFGIPNVDSVKFHPLYRINSELKSAQIEKIASALLIDPITEDYKVSKTPSKSKNSVDIEVWLKKGVTDPVADSVVKAVKDLGINKSITVKTGSKFILSGKVSKKAAEEVALKMLANPMIQNFTIR